jgi:hypothetical protein
MNARLIWAIVFAVVLLADDVRLRFTLVKTEKLALEATDLAHRLRDTNEGCFTTLDTCRDTVTLLADRSRGVLEYRMTPAYETLRRRADNYFRAVWASNSKVPPNIGPVSVQPKKRKK